MRCESDNEEPCFFLSKSGDWSSGEEAPFVSNTGDRGLRGVMDALDRLTAEDLGQCGQGPDHFQPLALDCSG